jgi:hypothetical protein
MKLKIELVPKTAWRKNLRSVLSQSEWDTIRKKTFEKDGYRCVYCGDTRRLHCHEVWHYLDGSHTQVLDHMETVCPTCHHIKHLGHAETLIAQKKLEGQALIDHFCKVNECTKEEFYEHREQAFQLWAERSRHPWKTVFGAHYTPTGKKE